MAETNISEDAASVLTPPDSAVARTSADAAGVVTPRGGSSARTGAPNLTGEISKPAEGLLDILRGQAGNDPDCAFPTFGGFVMLWGYLFKEPNHCDCSQNKGKWRLYLSLDFDEYIEFNQRSFAKQIDLFSAAQPLAGSLVWIDKDATVRRVCERSAEDEASFLRGNIERGFFNRPGLSAAVGLNAFSRGLVDPGSGGGCNTGASYTQCEITSPPGKK